MEKKNSKKNLKRPGMPGAGHPAGVSSPGSGRTPEWLKDKCKKIIDRKKLIEFLGDVASGADVDTHCDVALNGQAVKIKTPASIKDRLKATEILLERGFGKTEQPVAFTGDQSVTISITEKA